MTYAEAIKDSLNKIEEGIYPICFNILTRGLAGLALHLGQTLLVQDFCDVEIGGVKFSGKAKEHPDICHLKSLMVGGECINTRSLVYAASWQDFINWLLDQPIPDPDEDGMIIWYDQETLIDKWNEHAKIAINHNI